MYTIYWYSRYRLLPIKILLEILNVIINLFIFLLSMFLLNSQNIGTHKSLILSFIRHLKMHFIFLKFKYKYII